MNALNGMPGFPGSRAVCGASYEALETLRRPRAIDDFKAQGISLQASIYISKALVNLTRAFFIGTGTEVETSAGRNSFGRSQIISGTKDRVYSLRGEKLAFVPTFSRAVSEVKTSAGRNYFGRPISSLGQDTESITSAGRKYFGVLPTTFGTVMEVKTSAGRNYSGQSQNSFGTKDRVYSLRGEKLAFVPTFSAERKSCLCGEKQALLRQRYLRQALNQSVSRLPFNISRDIKEKTMVSKKMTYCLLSCALACLFVCGPAGASTLSTNFAEVYVDNLKIGGAYNLSETARYPMWVSYSGDVPVDLRFESVAPGSAELKSGYEPVPDASWITISRKSVSLLPDETVTADVTITVPNDEKYLGKKYQAYVLITSVPPKENNAAGMAFSLALKGRVLFTVAPKAPTQAELKEISRNKARGEAQGVIITPERFMVSASSTDTKAVITQDVPLKLINPSTEDVKIFIEAVDPQTNGISVPRGYTKGDIKNIEISKQKVTLKKDGIASIEMKANLNAKGAEKLFYAVRLILKTGTLELSRFVRIYIN